MRKYIWLMSIIAITMIISTASAFPEMLDLFNTKYNTVGTRLDTCDTCHLSGKPQKPTCDEICHAPVYNKPQKAQKLPTNLNPYGISLKNNLNIEIDQALAIIENLDSDGDKFTNIDEIHNLTFPGDKNDKPKKKGTSFLSNIVESLNIPISQNN